MAHVLTRNEINELRELSRSSVARQETHRVVVEGVRSIHGAIRAGAQCEQILAIEGIDFDDDQPIRRVDQKTIDKIATTTSPQGAIAICSMPTYTIEDFRTAPLNGQNVFVLDKVSDPGNIGTIIRSSVAFSIGSIVLIEGCDPFHPKVVRSSAGSLFACPIIQIDEYLIDPLLKQRPLYVADAHSRAQIDGLAVEKNAAIVFGNEAHGVTSEYFSKNTDSFTIPMAELCESLNVAMTATIVAHHIARMK